MDMSPRACRAVYLVQAGEVIDGLCAVIYIAAVLAEDIKLQACLHALHPGLCKSSLVDIVWQQQGITLHLEHCSS
jgi:hypothetical protein